MLRPGGSRESEIRAALAKLRGGFGAIVALSAFINLLTITGSLATPSSRTSNFRSS